MSGSTLFSLSALAALLPAALAVLRRSAGRDSVYWAALAVALAGTLSFTAAQIAQGWLTGLATALWASIAASLIVFAALAALSREAWRLTALLMPYLFLLGLGATAAGLVPDEPLRSTAPVAWIDLHILVALATYGLLTVAAVAGGAVLVQERALKRKRPTALSRALPSMADAEALQVKLLAATGLVLGLGLITGVATQYLVSGRLLQFDHKTLLSFLAFATIVGLLAVHRRSGLGGRRAARLVLLAYLLVTLAYPGVKFVAEVLLA